MMARVFQNTPGMATTASPHLVLTVSQVLEVYSFPGGGLISFSEDVSNKRHQILMTHPRGYLLFLPPILQVRKLRVRCLSNLPKTL